VSALRTLSSRQTFFLKIVSPLAWVLGMGGLVVRLFATPGAWGFTHDVRWGLLAVWLIGVAFAASSLRFKRIRMDGTMLYVSNYLQEIEVPLADVAAVDENLWLKTHPVTIRLAHDTAFGDRLVFTPRAAWFRWWAPHPVVAEIRDAASRARTGS